MLSNEPQKFKPITQKNFREDPKIIAHLNRDEQFAVDVVSHVLPFRTNNYVIDELIEWENYQNDPIYALTFPSPAMLIPKDFKEMTDAVLSEDKNRIAQTANAIRYKLNPHPAGQMTHNVPIHNGELMHGMQHKYRETVLFFPSEGQTCHAYCTYCFRWAQFIGDKELKFASRKEDLLAEYIRSQPQVTDILFTGGDPLIMRTKSLSKYVNALLDIPHLRNIRFGTKTLSYWPHRFLTDPDAKDLVNLLRTIIKAGKHISIMAHFTHPNELKTQAVADAVHLLRDIGANVRTQSPVMTHINDDADAWATMWRQQVHMGMIPYYMFIARDTGAQHFFGVPLAKAFNIFRSANKQVSGLARTVRGPSMSCMWGKVRVNGISHIKGEKAFTLEFLQGRDPDWIGRPFFAEYDENATWIDDLKPAFGEKSFFYENEVAEIPAVELEQTHIQQAEFVGGD
jgi:KamA family protein